MKKLLIVLCLPIFCFKVLLGSEICENHVDSCVRCEDHSSHRLRSLLVDSSSQLEFQRKGSRNNYSLPFEDKLIDNLFDGLNETLYFNHSKLRSVNHAFLSVRVVYRKTPKDKYYGRSFVLVFDEEQNKLVFKKTKDILSPKEKLGCFSFADFYTQFRSRSRSKWRDKGPKVIPLDHLDVDKKLKEMDYGVKFVGYDTCALFRNLSQFVTDPKQRQAMCKCRNTTHSEMGILSTLMKDPSILESIFLTFKKPRKIKVKSIIFRVHSFLDFCSGCQRALTHMGTLAINQLTKSELLKEAGCSFHSKKSPKQKNLRILITGRNNRRYCYNKYKGIVLKGLESRSVSASSLTQYPLPHLFKGCVDLFNRGVEGNHYLLSSLAEFYSQDSCDATEDRIQWPLVKNL